MSETETAPKGASASTAPGLATIVLPPRAKQNRGVKVDVRLRLLVRQVEPVKKEILQAIQDQVLNGAEAPRSSLIVGQIERAWFACVDDTIKELSK